MTTLYTLDEVATILRVSRRTVNRLVHEGAIRVIYPSPRSPRVTERELDAFLGYLSGRRRS